jgi:D-xylose 1-dehydrogenase (NADP+, D-xylono-1,5-lactone-forming)
MTGRRLQFGILGTGNIAHQFAEGVAGSRRSVVSAVGSRDTGSARAFADRYGVTAAHGSYDALLCDRGIEAVYVSLPNSLHHAWTIKALQAGKHVLCEKPIACCTAEAQEMFDTASRHGKVLVEAFMYRSHPLTRAVMEEVRRGTIGRVKLLRTSFCYKTNKIEGNVRFSRALAGGALMDIGCYCVDFARLVTGEHPQKIQCVAQYHAKGVDEYASGTLGYAEGVQASFCCGMTVQTDNAALICGDGGFIRVPVPWKPPADGACYEIDMMAPPRQDGVSGKQGGKRVIEVPYAGTLYGMEADAFAATVLDGQAPAVSAEDSLSNIRVLDELRRRDEPA